MTEIQRTERKASRLAMTALIAALAAVSCTGGPTPRSFEPEAGGRRVYNGVCYGPHRDGQRPGGERPSSAEILEDLELMRPHWKLLRVYASAESAGTTLDLIRREGLGTKVMLGAWIAPEERRNEAGEVIERMEEAAEANAREIEAAIRLAGAYPDVVAAVSVGNETQVSWSAHRSPLDILIGYLRQVREAVTVPVTVADDFSYWKKPESRRLAGEVDFITMHAHPMWNGVFLDGALDWLKERLQEVRSVHPGKAVVIGETGWATSALDEGEQGELIKGTPGEKEQKLFYDSVREWAASGRETVFFFEAFDENWKGGSDPREVEKHWGVFRADRSPKAAVAE